MGRINSGDLDQRVTLLTPSPAVSDGQGGNLPAATPDAETPLWAKVRQLSGTEVLALGQTNNPAAYEVTIRYHRNVAVGQRVRFSDGTTLNVQRLNSDTRHEYHVLTCFNSGK